MTEPMHTITATYRVVTPMFISGADPNRAELRLPSFKGVLRFWWRTLAWSWCEDKIATLKKAEDDLFGSTQTGHSRVRMRLVRKTVFTQLSPPNVLEQTNGQPVGEGARYLGYGVMAAFASRKKNIVAGQLTRACINAPCELVVECRCRGIGDEVLLTLLNAIRAMGLFGGLGSKSRKGYGSLVLEQLDLDGKSVWTPPCSAAEMADAIQKMYGGVGQSTLLPPFTALSSRSRHIIIGSQDNVSPMALLDRIGREVMRYRSWGHNGKVLGTDSEKNFRDDHDLMKKAPNQRNTHPRRIAFGLPHNYGKSAQDHVVPDEKGIDRRASPLFIHIHACNSTAIAVLSFLPSQFLPGGDTAKIDVGGKKVPVTCDPEIWKSVDGMLNRFLDPAQRRESFDTAQEVRS